MPAFASNPPTAMRTFARPLLILCLLAAVVAPGAFAADKPAKKEGSFGGAKATGAYLTKEQLRTCFAKQDKIKSDDDELANEQAAITAQKTEISRVGDELKTRLEAIDRTSAEAVDGYNNAVQARDKQIDAYQARVTAFNERVEANHTAHSEFSTGCSSRRYFEEDEIAIRKGK